tara:strand:- start:436 stop:654 length:219 start_codon:yes stop_codon:yes gene_type:complete
MSHDQVEAMNKFLKWLKTFPFSEKRKRLLADNNPNYTISSMQNNGGDNCIHVKFFLREEGKNYEVSEDKEVT